MSFHGFDSFYYDWDGHMVNIKYYLDAQKGPEN